jgi:hypothetical protein
MGMHEHETNEAFKKIMAIAGVAIANGEREVHHDGGYGSRSEYDAGVSAKYQTDVVCTPKTLPARPVEKAARAAVRANPVNAPMRGSSRRSAPPRPSPR